MTLFDALDDLGKLLVVFFGATLSLDKSHQEMPRAVVNNLELLLSLQQLERLFELAVVAKGQDYSL